MFGLDESFGGGPEGLGHRQKRFSLKLQGFDDVPMSAELFCDEGAVLMLVRPTRSDDLSLFMEKPFRLKLAGYVLGNLSKGVRVVREHDRGGMLFELTGDYFQIMLDGLFD